MARKKDRRKQIRNYKFINFLIRSKEMENKIYLKHWIGESNIESVFENNTRVFFEIQNKRFELWIDNNTLQISKITQTGCQDDTINIKPMVSNRIELT